MLFDRLELPARRISEFCVAAQNAKLNTGGAIGDRTLDYLKLSAVLKPGEPVYSILSGRWFGLW
jgi:hypothetical protein